MSGKGSIGENMIVKSKHVLKKVCLRIRFGDRSM